MSIKVLNTGTGYAPVVVCQFCGKRIERHNDGVALSARVRQGDGEHNLCFYLHAGKCHDAWERMEETAGLVYRWLPLEIHFAHLLSNVGLVTRPRG